MFNQFRFLKLYFHTEKRVVYTFVGIVRKSDKEQNIYIVFNSDVYDSNVLRYEAAPRR